MGSIRDRRMMRNIIFGTHHTENVSMNLCDSCNRNGICAYTYEFDLFFFYVWGIHAFHLPFLFFLCDKTIAPIFQSIHFWLTFFLSTILFIVFFGVVVKESVVGNAK